MTSFIFSYFQVNFFMFHLKTLLGMVHIVIPALRRLRQDHCEIKAILCYLARPCLRTKQSKTKNIFSIIIQ